VHELCKSCAIIITHNQIDNIRTGNGRGNIRISLTQNNETFSTYTMSRIKPENLISIFTLEIVVQSLMLVYAPNVPHIPRTKTFK
jgi:hypothetical protein